MNGHEGLFLAGPTRPIELSAVRATIDELADRDWWQSENKAFINTFEPDLNDFINQMTSYLSIVIDDVELANRYREGMWLMHHVYWLQSERRHGQIASITPDLICAYLEDQDTKSQASPSLSMRTGFEVEGNRLIQKEPALKPLRRQIKLIYGQESYLVLAGMADIYSLFQKAGVSDLMKLRFVVANDNLQGQSLKPSPSSQT